MKKEQLIEFLTSTDRGLHQLSKDQALSEIESLNECHFDALIKYYDAGLRGKHLRALRLYTDSYNYYQRPFDPNDMKVIDFLTSDERGERKLSPQNAVLEINGLSSGQMPVLCKLYDSGLRGQVLREHNPEESKINALTFLTAEARGSQKLTFPQAFSELKSMTSTQVGALIKYYDAGLRAEHLRALRLAYSYTGCYRYFDLNDMKVIDFLTSDDRGERKLSPQNAVLEINGLSSEQLDVFCKFYDSGLRGRVLCEQANHQFMINALSFLTAEARGSQKLTFAQTFSELKSLNEPQVGVLIEHYDAGLRPEHLRALRLSFARPFEPKDKKVIDFLTSDERGERKLSPQNALLEINGLTSKQVRLLRNLYDSGLRGQMLYENKWNTVDRPLIKAVSFLTAEARDTQKLTIAQAFSEQESLCWAQVDALIKHYDAGLRGEHLRALRLSYSHTFSDPYIFSKGMEVIDFLNSDERGEGKLSPQNAVLEINGLSSEQLDLLCKFYDSGLRGKVLYENKWHATDEFLINALSFLTAKARGNHKLTFTQAFSELKSLSKTQVDTLIKYYDAGLRGEQLRQSQALFELIEQIEQTLLSKTDLVPLQLLLMPIIYLRFRRDELKSHIKAMMLLPIQQDMDNALWADVLTDLNGVQLVMEILGQMSKQEFDALKIEIFLYKPPGMDRNLLEIMAGNPLFAEAIFSVKLIAKQNGAAIPILNIEYKPYTADELQAPVAIKIRQLFAQFNKNTPIQMQHFIEEFYTKSGSLHFALVQLNNNDEKRQDITKLLMQYLGSNHELSKTTDSLMQVIARFLNSMDKIKHREDYALMKTFLNERLTHLLEYNLLATYFKTDSLMQVIARFLISIDKIKHREDYALMKTFLNERLTHLLEYNLLATYFKTVSLFPTHALSDALHHNSEFFTPDRVAFMKQQEASLKPYFNQLGDAFNKAFQDACIKESGRSPLMNLSMFAQAIESDSSMPQSPAP